METIKQQIEVLSTADVCKILGVERTALWRYCKYSGLKKHKPKNGRGYFLRHELEEWIIKNL
jgi:predicted DNA-binding transcriptional regulator AlpA